MFGLTTLWPGGTTWPGGYHNHMIVKVASAACTACSACTCTACVLLQQVNLQAIWPVKGRPSIGPMALARPHVALTQTEA